jgi:ATP-dependent Clp protease ATP-binding subunit ClpA
VLFDEIEKAHSDVFNILLQVLEDGIVTDSQGRTVSFKNTIIIMTSNLGSNLILENKGNAEELKEELQMELRHHFRPEFLNRVDETLIFHALSKKDILNIVDIQLNHFGKLLANNEIKLKITESAKELLADIGYDPAFGARPLKRTVIKMLETPVSRLIISGQLQAGQTLVIDEAEKEIIFKIE